MGITTSSFTNLSLPNGILLSDSGIPIPFSGILSIDRWDSVPSCARGGILPCPNCAYIIINSQGCPAGQEPKPWPESEKHNRQNSMGEGVIEKEMGFGYMQASYSHPVLWTTYTTNKKTEMHGSTIAGNRTCKRPSCLHSWLLHKLICTRSIKLLTANATFTDPTNFRSNAVWLKMGE